MSVKYYNGDLLESGCDYICHQVNCQGVMGSGIAKSIREKWPVVFEKYKVFLDNPFWGAGTGCHQVYPLGQIQYVDVNKAWRSPGTYTYKVPATGEYTISELKQEINFHTFIAVDESDCWITRVRDYKLVKWNRKTREVTEWGEVPKGFEYQDFPYTNICGTKDILYLLSNQSNLF